MNITGLIIKCYNYILLQFHEVLIRDNLNYFNAFPGVYQLTQKTSTILFELETYPGNKL